MCFFSNSSYLSTNFFEPFEDNFIIPKNSTIFSAFFVVCFSDRAVILPSFIDTFAAWSLSGRSKYDFSQFFSTAIPMSSLNCNICFSIFSSDNARVRDSKLDRREHSIAPQ